VAAEIGVFGGSGFYSFLDDVTEEIVDTPFGAPSAPVALGSIDGRQVAFIARHGVDHQYPPSQVNFRANVWAMKELGVRRLLGPCAVGSLRADVHPGDFVVCDQLVDRTWGRADTFFASPVHLSFADPYCPELRSVVLASAGALGIRCHPTGTVVVIQGPRFSTRAESAWYRSAGFDVINMTQYPEAYLAREAGICYSAIALVTDYDTGVEGEPGVGPVTMDEVFAVLRSNVDRTRELLKRVVPSVPSSESATCACHSALPTGTLAT
jgi:5'-methylthioadenosine phosphorylase